MRVTFYSAVVLVAAGSVVLGLDWVTAPMPPMPQARNVVFVPPPPPLAPRAAPTPAVAPAPTSPPAAGQPSVQSPPANPNVAAVAPAPSPAVQAPVAVPPVAAAPKIKCDIDACESAYRSFRAEDCTYNPSFGPRRLCTKGDPEKYARERPQTVAPAAPPAAPAPAPVVPPVAQTVEPGSIMAPEPRTTPATPAAATPRCNVSACAAAYPRSFRAEDCTFNPSSGPRRVCEK